MGSDRGKNRLVHGDVHHVPAPGIGGEATPSSVPRESFEACYCVRPHGVYMSTIKRMVLVLAAVGMVSTQAYAGESAVSTAPLSPQLSTFSQDDINSMFEASGKPMQLAVLSTQEMKDTSGAAIWFAPVAWAGFRYAITGFTRHGINQVISRGGVGVSNQAILATMRNPSRIYSQISNQSIRYVGPNATVVTNQSGRVITAWGRPR